jgi:prepilin-type processing-associated H-X9-DG protein
LIELVVTMAIIGVLASLLLPSLTTARHSARRSACLNNLHQHGLGFAMYLGDHDGRYPAYETWYGLGGRTQDSTDNLDEEGKATRPLNPYVADLGAFRCPADRGANGVGAGGDPVRSCHMAWGNSYLAAFAYDVWGIRHVTGASARSLAAGNPDGPMLPPIRFIEIAISPSTKIVEGDWEWRDGLGTPAPSTWHGDRGRFPMLFADGHAVCQ